MTSNPLGEDSMQEVLGVGADYDRDEYEVACIHFHPHSST